jgi:hypothetical protein
MGCGITKKVVSRWSYKEGKELTYRQASQLLEIPDAVKTCLHSLHRFKKTNCKFVTGFLIRVKRLDVTSVDKPSGNSSITAISPDCI